MTGQMRLAFPPELNLTPEIIDLLNRGDVAALVASISGGKDSDALIIWLRWAVEHYGWNVPLIALHCDVGRMEHPETLEHCHQVAAQYADAFHVVKKSQDLIDAMWQRHETRPEVPPFPSAAARYCTAGWKRAETDVWIRQQFPGDATVIVAMGLRNEESRARSKKPDCWDRDSTAPTRNRRVIDWLPIRTFTLEDVWSTIGYSLSELEDLQAQWQHAKSIGDTGQMNALIAGFKAHVAYLRGNERLSCMMCVLGSENDLRNGAERSPAVYRELVALEQASGFAFQEGKPLSRLRPDLLTEGD